ncbi:conserved hypothetical protein [Histoplasma capsulatum G186AR]|uniref:Uncharacterized protein n=1 Tax=Ajellomyces capsulatus (strain G186AR / H82 / ATCC MYA-2454 / RMSCC 2432) TaxID=447093 RepID=C0NCT5_AJECG|nr:uncharacterized protein HCBG_00931 [Histoplasma capsulatum G186AR]EEH11476.1 conserved hypothetical protein [Histoplasma capsulatum G186AR]
MMLFPSLPPLPVPLALTTFLLGLTAAPFLRSLLAGIVARIASRLLGSSASKEGIIGAHAVKEGHGLYSLDHGVLNLPSLTPTEMWMNMGYWKNTASFPEACRALLDKILQTAGLDVVSTIIAVSDDSADATATGVDYQSRTNSQVTLGFSRGEGERGKRTSRNGVKRVILDVGFGCGEQTLYLMRKKATVHVAPGGGDADQAGFITSDGDDNKKSCGAQNKTNDNGKTTESTPLFQHYVGITIEKMQCAFALSRVEKAARNCNSSVRENGPSKDWSAIQWQSTSRVVELFCGDAAKPHAWSEEIQRSISTAFGEGRYAKEGGEVGVKRAEERYVLGLDTLYHFSPSRKELFEYSHFTLQATILAFDLFLPPKPPSSPPLDKVKRSLNMFALRCLAPALSAPFSNFVTMAEYKQLLEKAGASLSGESLDGYFAGWLADKCFGRVLLLRDGKVALGAV